MDRLEGHPTGRLPTRATTAVTYASNVSTSMDRLHCHPQPGHNRLLDSVDALRKGRLLRASRTTGGFRAPTLTRSSVGPRLSQRPAPNTMSNPLVINQVSGVDR